MKKKVGLLVDSLQVSKQIKDFIDMSLTSNNYEISTIIVNDSSILSELPRKKIFKYIQRKGFSKFINKVFFIIEKKMERVWPTYYLKIHINPLILCALTIGMQIMKVGHFIPKIFIGQ